MTQVLIDRATLEQLVLALSNAEDALCNCQSLFSTKKKLKGLAITCQGANAIAIRCVMPALEAGRAALAGAEPAGWQPIATAPKVGNKVLVANRHTKAVSFVWPAEASQPASDGSTLFEFWCRPIHPKETL